jgi:16S rRNA (uracil1498-N3)-methyltransferase
MFMDRFLDPSIFGKETTFSVGSPEEFHHLAHVLRLKVGDRIEITNGRGLLVVGEIVSVDGKQADVKVLESRSVPLAEPRIMLACAVPKRAKFEDIIDKCVQLGVDEIIPMETARSEVVTRGKDVSAKRARFDRVAVAAVKQSKRLWVPVIQGPVEFSAVLDRILPETLTIIPWLEGERMSLKEALMRAGGRKEILFLIGPEGDFTAQEVEAAKAKGAVAVSLGENVLRVDTAAELVVGAAKILL